MVARAVQLAVQDNAIPQPVLRRRGKPLFWLGLASVLILIGVLVIGMIYGYERLFFRVVAAAKGGSIRSVQPVFVKEIAQYVEPSVAEPLWVDGLPRPRVVSIDSKRFSEYLPNSRFELGAFQHGMIGVIRQHHRRYVEFRERIR